VPIRYRIDADSNLLNVQVDGKIVPDDVVRYRSRLLSDPEFIPGTNTLVDCRNASTEGLTSGDLRFLADDVQSRRRLLGRAKCAVLVATDAAFGMMRMYEACSLESPVAVRVFRDEGEALVWLSEPEPAA
jgi:hypothetical protein